MHAHTQYTRTHTRFAPCPPCRHLLGALESMRQSNGPASALLVGGGVTACTDVTGFGLLGHAAEMASASKVRASVPLRAMRLQVC